MKKKMRRGICFLLAVFFWILAWEYGKPVRQAGRYVGGYYEKEVMTAEQVSQFLQEKQEAEDMPEVTGWRQIKKILMQGENGRSTQGEVWLVMGSMEKLFFGKLSAGSYPMEDGRFCMVSTGLAEALFGSKRPLGAEIVFQNQTYWIQGVFEETALLLAAEADKEEGLEHFLLSYADTDVPLSQAENFFYQMTGEEAAGIFEGCLYQGLGNLLLALPVWCLGILCFLGIWGKIQENLYAPLGRFSTAHKSPAGALGMKTFCALCFLCLCLWGIGQSFAFSEDYLPAMWSDLSFFPELFQEKSRLHQELLQIQPGLKEKEVLEGLKRLSLLCLGSAALEIAAGVRTLQAQKAYYRKKGI